MRRLALALFSASFFLGCGGATYDTTTTGTGELHWPDGDVGTYLLNTADEYDGFESDLGAWGAPHAIAVSETDTGIAQIVGSGTDFSTRLGEEQLVLHGGHSLVLQATTGEANGLATITSDMFVPYSEHLMFSQMSEVDGRGIELWIEVYSVIDGLTLPTMYDIPVVTGGHVPGLEQGDDTLDGFADIVHGQGTAGHWVWQAIDISEFNARGNEIQVRFVQRSSAAPYDFFTLIDNVSMLDIPAAYQDDLAIIDATRPY